MASTSNIMGSIENDVSVGDGIGDVFVYGFNTQEEAIEYAKGAPALKPGNTVYQKELAKGESLDFEGSPWFVFWHITGALDSVVLMVARCYAGLTLSIGSWGGQLLLKKQ